MLILGGGIFAVILTGRQKPVAVAMRVVYDLFSIVVDCRPVIIRALSSLSSPAQNLNRLRVQLILRREQKTVKVGSPRKRGAGYKKTGDLWLAPLNRFHFFM